jgi:hypothetical protein
MSTRCSDAGVAGGAVGGRCSCPDDLPSCPKTPTTPKSWGNRRVGASGPTSGILGRSLRAGPSRRGGHARGDQDDRAFEPRAGEVPGAARRVGDRPGGQREAVPRRAPPSPLQPRGPGRRAGARRERLSALRRPRRPTGRAGAPVAQHGLAGNMGHKSCCFRRLRPMNVCSNNPAQCEQVLAAQKVPSNALGNLTE